MKGWVTWVGISGQSSEEVWAILAHSVDRRTLKIEKLLRAETKGWFLPGVVFAKGCGFLLVSLGEGLRVGQVGIAGARPAKELASQCARVCQN